VSAALLELPERSLALDLGGTLELSTLLDRISTWATERLGGAASVLPASPVDAVRLGPAARGAPAVDPTLAAALRLRAEQAASGAAVVEVLPSDVRGPVSIFGLPAFGLLVVQGGGGAVGAGARSANPRPRLRSPANRPSR
jgi:hypothetical protein